MALPFTHDAFLDVFGRYNTLLWPAVVALWAVTVVIVFNALRTGHVSGRVWCGLLAVHWGWSGVAYHWAFFRSINPAATMFAAVFVVQAIAFAWWAFRPRAISFSRGGRRGAIGTALVLYGMAYPFLGVAFGLEYPRLPLFAVPCPTTLMTAGVLVMSSGLPRVAGLLPMLWAIIGSSAAFALGIRADLALVVAVAALALDMLAPSALGTRGR